MPTPITQERIDDHIRRLRGVKSSIVWIRYDLVSYILGEALQPLILHTKIMKEDPPSHASMATIKKMEENNRISGYHLIKVKRKALLAAIDSLSPSQKKKR